ncbi:MAG: hypothetical protein NTY19_37815 [Planctomycetota bacterium]|nr:hypothetical protein [Planctomycetota bacterium]
MPGDMLRRVLQTISWLACIGTVVPAVLFFLDRISLDQVKTSMLVVAVVWFVVTPLWMGREQKKRMA